jgi:DNA adenine methylase
MTKKVASLPKDATENVARSIVKWAGGKKALLGELLPLVPVAVERYFEPFAGGAALFFALASETPCRFKKATLADTNADLVALYQALKTDADALIETLGQYRYDEAMFYATRDVDPATLDPVGRAARLLFLNKTCFNGLWRVNSKGKFNVPFGRLVNPKIVDPPRLRAASKALRHATCKLGDFAKITKNAKPGDFVYFDPPYAPISSTANFTAYGSAGFGPEQQTRLVEELSRLKALKVRAVLSNADTPYTRELYARFSVRVVHMRRSINSATAKRGLSPELLVDTWGKPGIIE